MTPLHTCLSILPLIAQTITPTPVDKIIKKHVAKEIKKSNPGLTVNFDHRSCPNIAHYEETDSSIIISGNNSSWRGEKEIFYTDALSQRDLNFEPNLAPAMFVAPKKNHKPLKKWVLIGAAAIVAVGAGYYFLKNKKSETTSNIGISF